MKDKKAKPWKNWIHKIKKKTSKIKINNMKFILKIKCFFKIKR